MSTPDVRQIVEELKSTGRHYTPIEAHGRFLAFPTFGVPYKVPSNTYARRIELLWNNAELLLSLAERAEAASVGKDQAVMLCWGGVMPSNAAWPGDADRAAEMIRNEGDALRESEGNARSYARDMEAHAKQIDVLLTAAEDRVRELEAKVLVAETALEFYAAKENWKDHAATTTVDGLEFFGIAPVKNDGGFIATAALAAIRRKA